MNNQNYLKAEKFFEVPVMISVLMLIPVLIIEYTQQSLSTVALYLNWGIWIVFLLEYVILFYFAEDKMRFVKSHKIELIIVIFSFPIVPEGLESSGFLRFARLPRLLNALRFFRLAALLSRFGTTVKSIFNSKGLRFIVYATIAIVLFFGFLFYISEPDVQSYSDGLWWALVTITTVGYGDITPLTNLGRIIASSLMIMGIGFKSIFNSKGLRFIVYATIAIVLFFGFLFYISEPDVQSYSDGLWWALVTITTVGYGDITPLTNLGRIIASSLMIMGIGFIATITAAVSSYFISSFNDKELTINELGDKLDKLEEEIKSLKKEINDK